MSNSRRFVTRSDTNNNSLVIDKVYYVKKAEDGDNNNVGPSMKLTTMTDRSLQFIDNNGKILFLTNESMGGAENYLFTPTGGRIKTRIMRKKHRRTPRNKTKTRRNKTKTRRNKTRWS